MSRVLHITNGDSAANTLKASAVDGDVLPWRDPMHHGPFPAGLGLEALSEIRSHYLAGPGLDPENVARDFRQRDEHLKASAGYDEIILWFEHDLLDQLQILQVLDWYAANDIGCARLAMICVGTFPGMTRFRGLGELDCGQMASLMGTQQTVTDAQLALANTGWAAFTSADPKDIETLLASDLRALPYLQASLTRYREEFPWVTDGLSRTERQILKLVANGVSRPGRIFVENMDLESVLFIGDWPTYSIIKKLNGGPKPLLNCEPGGVFRHPLDEGISRDGFLAQRLLPTPQGEQVLTGELDAKGLVARDEWLGGVHLQSGRPMWKWDSGRGCLRHCQD